MFICGLLLQLAITMHTQLRVLF